MPFNVQKFLHTACPPRTATVPVPDLAHWFDDDPAPVWTVRNLTGEEVFRAEDAGERLQHIQSAVLAILEGGSGLKDAYQELMGLGSVPPKLATRIEWLMYASVDPPCDRDIAIKLFRESPVVAGRIVGKIAELINLGADWGKVLDSTRTPASESA